MPARDTFPGYLASRPGGLDASEELAVTLYGAAYAPWPHELGDPEILILSTLDHDEGLQSPHLQVFGIVRGKNKETLLFSEPGLPLQRDLLLFPG